MVQEYSKAMNNGFAEQEEVLVSWFQKWKRDMFENDVSAAEVGIGNEDGSPDVQNYETLSLMLDMPCKTYIAEGIVVL